MSWLGLSVHGTPAPQGSKRHVGKGVMVESSEKVKPWREAVKWAALEAMKLDGTQRPLEGPLHIGVTFTLPKPASAPKTRRSWPSKRPDLDKLIRSTLDGLGEAGVWIDDAQVIQISASKVYPTEGMGAMSTPGARIAIRQEDDPQ
jgi:Holliday junction resolvase RusA-like endonuclease